MVNSRKSGYVSIIGNPNVGKSTLLNSFLGQELSVVTPKPQTTRNNISGIYTNDNVQIIFLDTPGILKPKYKLHDFMEKEIEQSLGDSDIVLFLIDGSKYDSSELVNTISNFKKLFDKKFTFCVINKIDLLQKAETLHIINDISSKYNFKEIFPVSAKKSFNTDELLNYIIKYLPEGEFYFEDDIIASQPEKFFIAEIIRGEVMKLFSDELPFSVFVEIVDYIERKNEKDYVRVNILLDRESHKKIIIGSDGRMIKKIGLLARKRIEEFINKEVYLDIFVKVQKNWKNDELFLKKHFKKTQVLGV